MEHHVYLMKSSKELKPLFHIAL